MKITPKWIQHQKEDIITKLPDQPKPNLPQQTYKTKPTKSHLPNHFYQTIPTKINLPKNQENQNSGFWINNKVCKIDIQYEHSSCVC